MRIFAALLLMIATGAPLAEESPALPFSLPVPADWRAETILFPLSFAPALGYAGVEELRFSPGMFKPDSEDFWSYAFVWWLEGEHELDGGRLGRELKVYFRGLARAVRESQEDPPGLEYKVNLALREAGTGSEHLEGTAETHDAFVTKKTLLLNVKVSRLSSPEDVTVFFFALSPQPLHHGIWNELESIREGYSYHSAASDPSP